MTFKWTPEIEDEIFGRMIKGEGIVAILGADKDDFLPSEATFYRKLQSGDAAFCEKYARARESQAHREAEEIKQIADAATPENVHVARLRMDARKWRAGKLAPKVYGDKIEVNGPGENGEHVHKVEMTFVRPIAIPKDG
jgi:hypothetical protein